jgi:hypothetical protein
LNEVVNTGDAFDFLHVLGITARAKGMPEMAEQAGVTRASLYESLAEDGIPGLKPSPSSQRLWVANGWCRKPQSLSFPHRVWKR